MVRREELSIQDVIDSKEFSPLILDGELPELEKRFGRFKVFKVTLDFDERYFDYWDDLLRKRQNRRGEVTPVIENSQHRILLHTKSDYPKAVYRLPTGGIHMDEKVLDALYREIYEETGLKVESAELMALLLYEFRRKTQMIPFLSFIFRVRTNDAEPKVMDPNEKISGFRWIDPQDLDKILAALHQLPDDWSQWGIMRAVPHEIVREMLGT